MFTGRCSPDTCKFPKCRCAGSDIPGGVPPKDTPMMVMLTFDDSVNVANFDYYTQVGWRERRKRGVGGREIERGEEVGDGVRIRETHNLVR